MLSRLELIETHRNSSLIKYLRLSNLSLTREDPSILLALEVQATCKYGLLTLDGSNSSDYKETISSTRKERLFPCMVVLIKRTEILSSCQEEEKEIGNNGRSSMLMLPSQNQLLASNQISDSISIDHSTLSLE